MTQAEFIALCKSKTVILDGAMGTELIKRGRPAEGSPELWCCEHPETVIAVQQAYFAAGSDLVYTATFGGNPLKLAEFGLADRTEELNCQLAAISRQAAGSGKLVFGDLSSTGRFLVPTGDLDLEAAIAAFKRQVKGLLDGGVDGFAVETMMDLAEARAALIAVRELCDLPCIVTLTFEPGGRTLSGNDPAAALIALQSLGASAVGCNCSTGPEAMAAQIAQMKPFAKVPLVAKPNAGLPKLLAGKTVFAMSPEEFGKAAALLVNAGAGLIGGCCGTTPEHLAMLAHHAASLPPPAVKPAIPAAVASARRWRTMGHGEPFGVIGERINPTGKKTLQAELRAGSTEKIFEYALDQTADGAALLDVNVGMAGIDETAMMRKAVDRVQQASDLPLCIDTTSPSVAEAALRRYPGRALLNSISAETGRLENLLPVAARYGAMLIVLPLTDAGIPPTLEGRIAAVQTVMTAAAQYGYAASDLCVDALVMTAATDPEAPQRTLALIDWCSKQGLATVCGLSNVSFGLPSRPVVNRAFLQLAMAHGLDLAIANPLDTELTAQAVAADLLRGRDPGCRRYLERFGNAVAEAAPAPAATPPAEKVRRALLLGNAEGIPALCREAVASGTAAADLLDQVLIPAITTVGSRFEKQEYCLPQLMQSAAAMRAAVEAIEPELAAVRGSRPAAGKILLATVKGDVHDIGKNIVAILLKNYGFTVIDLGKDVPAETIVAAARKEQCRLIGLSALMTTTMVQMKTVIDLARAEGLDAEFIVGGAVLDAEYAASIGAHYAANALATVQLAQKLRK